MHGMKPFNHLLTVDFHKPGNDTSASTDTGKDFFPDSLAEFALISPIEHEQKYSVLHSGFIQRTWFG